MPSDFSVTRRVVAGSGLNFVLSSQIELMKQLLIFVLLGCSSWSFSQKKMRMEVREVPVYCQGMVPKTCLQYRLSGDQDWSVFQDKISNFVYQVGFVYTLEVIQSERPKPVPADLSAYRYTLSRIVSQKAVPVSSQMMRWDVVRLNGAEVTLDQLNVQFDSTGARMFGQSGCNRYSGMVSFNKKTTKAKTDHFIATRMACESERMTLEDQFLKVISKRAFKMKVEDGLWIWTVRGKEVLALKSVPVHFIHPIHPYGKDVMPTPEVQPTNLEERSAIDFFQGKELRVLQLRGVNLEQSELALTFDFKGGRISGNTGCNTLGGLLQYDGEKLIVSEVIATKMACLDAEQMDRERELLGILAAGELRYDAAEVVLNLYVNGELVLMLAPKKVRAAE